eukprot:COSAG05_NODE_939_length_6517_cov_2.480524_1_plen_89_part_00
MLYDYARISCLVSVRRQYTRRVRTSSAELKAVAKRDHALLIPPNILMGGERLLHGCIMHEVSHSMITSIVLTIIIIIIIIKIHKPCFS